MKVHMKRVLCVECVTRVECGAIISEKGGYLRERKQSTA
jgi:hypothetical protein